MFKLFMLLKSKVINCFVVILWFNAYVVVAVKVEDDTVKVTPGTKSGSKRTVKRVVKKTVVRKKAKLGDVKVSPDSVFGEQDDSEVREEQERSEEVKGVVDVKQEELSPIDVKDQVAVKAEGAMKDVEDDADIQATVEGSLRLESSDVVDEAEEVEKENMVTETRSLENQEPVLEKEEVADEKNNETDDEEPFEIEEPGTEDEGDVEKLVENQEIALDKEPNVEIKEVPTETYEDTVNNQSVDMEKSINEEFKGDEDPQERLCFSDEEKDRDISNDGHEEEDDDELADVKMKEHDELRFQEHEHFTVAAEERKRRKEFEIFLGGLDRDATEEEVKRFFQNVGEVVEVRMNKELPSNKNKGYAFVRFATKEQVARALAEMKNPVVCFTFHS